MTTYAPRIKVWPPEGYTAPTAEEFDALLRAARTHHNDPAYLSRWRRLSNGQVLRRAQLVEMLPARDRDRSMEMYDYSRALRRELSRRGMTFTSLALHQCGACNHSTERLFEATQKTHPGMVNRSDELIDSAWFCARCWSGDQTEEDE